MSLLSLPRPGLMKILTVNVYLSDLTFSLPKLKGFKIAFVNIVSLPKYLDELFLRMQSQTLALLALSETRLDNTFTDSAVSIDG